MLSSVKFSSQNNSVGILTHDELRKTNFRRHTEDTLNKSSVTIQFNLTTNAKTNTIIMSYRADVITVRCFVSFVTFLWFLV